MTDLQLSKDATFYKAQYFITEEELEAIRNAAPSIEDEFRAIFDEMYRLMHEHPTHHAYYSDSIYEGIKANEKAFWDDVVLARLNDTYINTQTTYGQYFASTGMPQDAYLYIVVAFFKAIEDAYIRQNVNSEILLKANQKFLRIPLDIITGVYTDAVHQAVIEQNKALKELSTPIAKIWKGILLLPLVGFVDSRRANGVMTTMLNKIAETQSRVFILDISGIAVVDTAVANHLIKMTQAARLLGCTCIISGISSAVAQTIVELGIQTNEIETTGDMEAALHMAMTITG